MRSAGKTIALMFSLYCVSVCAATDRIDQPVSAIASPNANNSELNSRDKSGAAPTPQNQSNKAEDRKVLAAVRHSVVENKSLSTAAHNVKILVADGVVTLRGPVKSVAEKDKIEKIASQVSGVSAIDNQLDIKTQ